MIRALGAEPPPQVSTHPILRPCLADPPLLGFQSGPNPISSFPVPDVLFRSVRPFRLHQAYMVIYGRNTVDGYPVGAPVLQSPP